jgi:hypothetical protein
MIASYGETSGFSAVGVEELALVNGGKGGGGGGGNTSNKVEAAVKEISKYVSGTENSVTVSMPVNDKATINFTVNGGIKNGSPQVTGGGISLKVNLQ